MGTEKPGLFIEYCNFLINDINSLLFEGIIFLEEIKNYEEISTFPDFTQIDQEERNQMLANYQDKQKRAQANFQLSNKIIQLLSRVTYHIKEPFISEELGEPFANAIDFCLDSLIGKKGLKLKVNNPDRYNFDPRSLLSNIINMYANMSDQEIF